MQVLDFILTKTVQPHLSEQSGRPWQFIQLNIGIYRRTSFIWTKWETWIVMQLHIDIYTRTSFIWTMWETWIVATTSYWHIQYNLVYQKMLETWIVYTTSYWRIQYNLIYLNNVGDLGRLYSFHIGINGEPYLSVMDLGSWQDFVLEYTGEPHLSEQSGSPGEFIQLNIVIYSRISFISTM